MTIDIFCEVIDYYGDVAVAMRLALAVKAKKPAWVIRFFCNNYSFFNKLFNYDDTGSYRGIRLYNDDEAAKLNKADAAIEMLACQLPVGYQRPPLVINLEYFTAESWAGGYHLQPSLIGGGSKKYFFMPGVTNGTGGLVSNNTLNINKKNFFSMFNSQCLIFNLYASLYLYHYNIDELAAQPATAFFIVSPKPKLLPKNCIHLPHLYLSDYDKLVQLCDYNLVRGEDSLSRALLSGKPFLWQAYKQEEDYHLVKVKALLEWAAANPQLSSEQVALIKQFKETFITINNNGQLNLNFIEQNYAKLAGITQILTTAINSLGTQEDNLIDFISKNSK
ncbi:MAG: elongation factor P maturation arginine rhamnosyltransferase EarP [Spirochaetaceae bacterium]|nr:elongation factor P maturation arginine rhamnosyltransferase EarP [Spirochaetaceae bacterium]